jgi:polyketide synthase 13
VALAYACAIGLSRAAANRRLVGLIDIVHPGVERRLNVQSTSVWQPEQLDDEVQVRFVLDTVNGAARSARAA